MVRQIVNDLGERVWPRDENVYATEPDGRVGEARHVEVVYQLVKPTVDEKVDEILRLMRLFENAWDNRPEVDRAGGAAGHAGGAASHAADHAAGAVGWAERETIRAVFLRNGFTIKGRPTLNRMSTRCGGELLSIARADGRTRSAPVSRRSVSTLEPGIPEAAGAERLGGEAL